MPATKFYRCKKCGMKVVPTYLAKHWLNAHFNLMYDIVEYSTQTTFQITGESSPVKTKDEIDKEYGFAV